MLLNTGVLRAHVVPPWFPVTSTDGKSWNPWAIMRRFAIYLSHTPQRKEIHFCYDTSLLRSFRGMSCISLCGTYRCLCEWVHICISVHACMCKQKPEVPQFFSTLLVVFAFCLFWQGSQWTWTSSLWLGCLANEQGSLCLHASPTLSSGIMEMIQLGIQTIDSVLCRTIQSLFFVTLNRTLEILCLL